MKMLVTNTMVKIPDELLGNSWLHEVDGGNFLMGKFLEAMVTTLVVWDILVIL